MAPTIQVSSKMFTSTVHRRLIVIVLAGMIIVPGALAVMSLFSTKPNDLGVRNGRLAACPETPNCVSSQADDPRHAVDAIGFAGSAETAMERLRCVLREHPRIRITADDGRYIHAESRSRLFRFVDDLEFLVDPQASVIHVRSASRVGYSDLGVNRTRVEAIRSAFERLARST
jgi:uncharacterized protein (DUF1499 family)